MKNTTRNLNLLFALAISVTLFSCSKDEVAPKAQVAIKNDLTEVSIIYPDKSTLKYNFIYQDSRVGKIVTTTDSKVDTFNVTYNDKGLPSKWSTSEYFYDNLNKLIKMNNDDITYLYTYDSDGRMIKMEDDDSEVIYEYVNGNAVKSTSYRIINGVRTLNDEIQYEFDDKKNIYLDKSFVFSAATFNANNITKATTKGGVTTFDYLYNPKGDISTITIKDPINAGSSSTSINFKYN